MGFRSKAFEIKLKEGLLFKIFFTLQKKKLVIFC